MLFTIAVFRFPTDDLRISFQLLAEVGAYAVFAYLLWGINKWMAMFAIIVCISSLFPQYDKATFLASHAVFYGLLWYYVVYEKGDVDLILNAMCLIAMVNVFFLCLQFLNIDPLFDPLSNGAKDLCTGVMGNQNETSAVLALCFPAFLRKKWWLLIPIVLVGLALSKSFGGVLAVIIGGLYYSWNKIDKRVVVGVFVLLLIGFLLIDTPGIIHRWDTWVVAAKLYIQHPLLGSGIGHWKYIFVNIDIGGRGVWMPTAHNEYVQGIFEMGMPFIIILIGFLLALRIRLKKANDILVVASIIILINCFVNFPLHIAVTAYMILTWIAIIDRSYHGKTEFPTR